MSVYVVFLARGRMLGWNRKPIPPEGMAKGWRPFVWVKSLVDAEKFGSEAAARQFAFESLKHDRYRVVCVSRPSEDMLA